MKRRPVTSVGRRPLRCWALGAAVSLAAVWLLVPGSGRGGAVEAEADAARAPASRVAHLQFREVDFAPLCTEIAVESSPAFSKEPAWGRNRVFRGLFRLGADTNQFVPFAWDSEAAKLHVDLNRNRDLTDDPNGALVAPSKSLQLFRGLGLEFPSPSGPYRVIVDAHVFGGLNNLPRVFLYVRSLWEGEVQLNSQRWYLAVIDHPDGRLGPAAKLREVGDRMVLRPWEAREAASLWWHASLEHVHALSHVKLVTFPYRWAGNAEVFDAFNLPANLFLRGQGYRLDARVERAAGVAHLAVSFTPTNPPLGTLRFDGEFVRRVVLDGGLSPGGFSAVLDAPEPAVAVPVGDYPRQITLLQRPGFANVAVAITTNQLSITENRPATWAAGGPLNNSLEVELRHGRTYLNYRLTNGAGAPFHLASQEEHLPPRFEARQGERLIAQGQFEFG